MGSSRVIKIVFNGVGSVLVEVKEDWNPKTVRRVLESLPLSGRAMRWGDEVYFEVNLNVEEENSRVDMEVGEVAFWPPGNAICLFFGRTPVSVSDKPRAYSPVNPFGVIVEGIDILRKVKGGEKVTVVMG
ncbi:MAG: cyclophilin-like family protein [Candidatus Bathyarchaeia archaeon]